MTVKEFLKSIASKIGRVDAEEDLTTAQYNILLKAVNSLLGEWSGRRITVISETSEDLTLDVGVEYKAITYFSTKVISCFINYNDSIYEVKVKTRDEYDLLRDTVSRSMPDRCYLNRNSDPSKIYFNPIPDYGYSCTVLYLRPYTEISDLNATFDIPRPYERAIKLNVAVDVASDFHREVTPTLYNDAERAMRVIEAINAGNNSSSAVLDQSLPGMTSTRYNIWEG